MKKQQLKILDVLIVEDNPGDVELTVEILKECEVQSRLYVVLDGEEALAFLRNENKYSGAPRPDLILLDLKLPRKSGREVLAEIKRDPSLRRIPVVIFTTSVAREDLHAAYDLQANCYIAKPMDLEHFMHTVRHLGYFWLSIAELPQR